MHASGESRNFSGLASGIALAGPIGAIALATARGFFRLGDEQALANILSGGLDLLHPLAGANLRGLVATGALHDIDFGLGDKLFQAIE